MMSIAGRNVIFVGLKVFKKVTYFDFNFSRRFEKCREVGMSRNAEKKKVVSASNLLRKIESNNSKDNEEVSGVSSCSKSIKILLLNIGAAREKVGLSN